MVRRRIGEDEVVDDAGPEIVGHAEVFRLHEGELLEAEERVGRKDEGPDLVEVGVGETEGVEHGSDVGSVGDAAMAWVMSLRRAGCRGRAARRWPWRRRRRRGSR